MVYFGYINFLRGFSQLPHAVDDADRLALLPRSRSAAALIALFAIEQLVNGWRNGFEGTAEDDRPPPDGVPSP